MNADKIYSILGTHHQPLAAGIPALRGAQEQPQKGALRGNIIPHTTLTWLVFLRYLCTTPGLAAGFCFVPAMNFGEK